ncbi:hypothetical protein Leucomu_02805 [Leucobacter muris]|uniref:Uncharacterized protein n=1 Tax=Leucobacter muris TaxID=1935379 RepID=A0ABX5QD43_9MICO|nr:hypothetical protein [Leucobacter muris]QAB16986.1 hypothetical protein Leucomu_02805 [Leucobacter muris]
MSSMVLDGGMPRSRSTDPVTSVDAGRSVDLVGSQAMVLELLEDLGPCTDYELEDNLKDYYSPQRVRTARSELVVQGLVEDTGAMRISQRGRRRKHHAKVWRVKQE